MALPPPQDIPSMSNVLASLIQITMDPMISHQQRLESYEKIEDFKDNSPYCAQCGLYLVQNPEYSHIVRHTGIQFMEHCIKHRWHNLSQEEKLFIKENCISLLNNSNIHMIELFTNYKHTCDALAKIFVEMIKREWPQHWPNMFLELNNICEQGSIQTQLILYIFLRLSEDIVSLQTIESSTRRKDLCLSLNNYMKDILNFLSNNLNKYFYISNNSNLIELILITLNEYFEWIPLNYIFEFELLIIQLFELINIELYQIQVCNVLEKLCSRRGKIEDKIIMYKLLTQEDVSNNSNQMNRNLFHNIHQTVVQYQTKGVLSKHVLEYYKSLSSLMKSYMSLLCSCYTPEDTKSGINTLPSIFSSQLNILIILLQSKCLHILDNVYTTLNMLFKHSEICKTEAIQNVLNQYVLITCKYNLVRNKTLTINHNNVDLLSDDDYMDEVDYRRHFVKIKILILTNFKELTKLVPDLLFLYGENWLITCATGNTADVSEWEALSIYLDTFMSNIESEKYITNSLTLINLLLNFTTSDALIYSHALSCISSLFHFFTIYTQDLQNQYLPKVLDKIFSLLLFNNVSSIESSVITSTPTPSIINKDKYKSIQILKKHCSSLIVKLCNNYSNLLNQYFNIILNFLITYNLELNQLIINCLIESLILINNNCNNYDKQINFINNLLQFNNLNIFWNNLNANVLTITSTQTIQQSNINVSQELINFINFIGLNKKISINNISVGSTSIPIEINNRIQIIKCIHLISAILRRCKIPKNINMLKQGGFYINNRVMSPVIQPLLPYIPAVLKLVNILEQLYNKEYIIKNNLINSEYAVCLDIDESEKKNVLGEQYFGNNTNTDEENSDTITEKSPVAHMQTFLNQLFENLFIILGYVTKSMTHEVYHISEFSSAINENLFNNIQYVPNYRIRYIIRHFIKYYVLQCPEDQYDNVLIPFMNYFTTHMYQRINTKWESLSEIYQKDKEEREEAVDEVILVMMQREYMEVIRDLLMAHNTNPSNGGTPEDDTMTIETATTNSNRIEVLTSLGIKMIRNKPTSDAILMFLIRCLSYNDTVSSLKTGRYLVPIIIQLINDNLINEEIVRVLFMNLLQAIHVHGEHDANMGCLIILCVQLYTLLRPSFELVKQMLLLIPNVNIIDVNKFDEKILNYCNSFGINGINNSNIGIIGINNENNCNFNKSNLNIGILPLGASTSTTIPSSNKNILIENLIQNKSEKAFKDMFKKLVTNIIGKNIGQLFKCKTNIKELPRIVNVKNKENITSDEIHNIAHLFN